MNNREIKIISGNKIYAKFKFATSVAKEPSKTDIAEGLPRYRVLKQRKRKTLRNLP